MLLPFLRIRTAFAASAKAWAELLRDFTLGREDMKAVEAIDIGRSEIISHYSECTAKALNQTKIHD